MGHTKVHIWPWILLQQCPKDVLIRESIGAWPLSAVCSLALSCIHHSCIGDLRRSTLACSLYCLFMDPLSLDLSNPFLNLLILSACGRCYRSSLWQQIPEIHYSLSRNVPSSINSKWFPTSFSECLPHLIILSLVKNSSMSTLPTVFIIL